MSRTPKNQNHSSNDAFNTPTRRELLKPKLRVLFQTPTNRTNLDCFKKIHYNSSSSLSSDLNSSKLSMNFTKITTIHNETIVQADQEHKSIVLAPVDSQMTEYYLDSSDNSSSSQNSLDNKTKRYHKSEPNLSILCDSNIISNSRATNRNSLPNNFSKCISMGDMRLSSFSTDSKIYCGSNSASNSQSFENMLSNSSQQYGTERNWSDDYIMQTPLQALDRDSMSPITKSTQRMPKSMQESIMTPRSRKPVILLGLNLTCSDAYQSTICSSLNEEDEDVFLISDSPTQLHRSKSDGDFTVTPETSSDSPNIHIKSLSAPESLSSVFKEYLFQRNVVTTSPVDSSFSSQPDDFGSSNDLDNITNANLSESLLYCLDGNKPDDRSYVSDETNSTGSVSENDRQNVYSLSSSESRKRLATSTMTEYGAEDETDIDSLHCKKLVLDNFELDETEL